MQKNPKTHKNNNQTTTKAKPQKAYFGLLWINERVATIINQIHKGKQVTQSGGSLCYLQKTRETRNSSS